MMKRQDPQPQSDRPRHPLQHAWDRLNNADRELEENNAWDRLGKWQTVVDEKIRDLIGDGDMSWHPGAGKPLDLSEDHHIPEEMRMAYKIMRDNDAVPPWISQGYALRERHDKIVEKLRLYAQAHVKRSHEARLAGSFVRQKQADDRWKSAVERLQPDVLRYNRELMDYNLTVPPTVGQMVPFNLPKAAQSALDRARREFVSADDDTN